MVTMEHKRIDDEKKAETELSKSDCSPKTEEKSPKEQDDKDDDGPKETMSK